MSDLVAFLTARLDEDEAAARKYLTRYVDGEWVRVFHDPVIGPFGGQSAVRDVATGHYVAAMSDPARVLREVAAKRAILAMHEADAGRGYKGVTRCIICDVAGDTYWPCRTLLALAAVYSDHRDYDAAWSLSTVIP